MKLVCPHCLRRFELVHAVRELKHRELVDLSAKFGKSWSTVFEYSECFRQSEFGTVSLLKRVRILREVAALFETLTFAFQSKQYRTTRPDVLTAMTEICNRNKWGFPNQNYLKVMLIKSSERLSAEGLTAREETRRETERAKGLRGAPVARPPEPFRAPAETAPRVNFAGIIKNLEGSNDSKP